MPISNPAAPAGVVEQSQQGQTAATTSHQAVTGETKIGSMNDLKRLSPKLYKSMMTSIGYSICHDMQQHADKLKEIIKEGDRNAQG